MRHKRLTAKTSEINVEQMILELKPKLVAQGLRPTDEIIECVFSRNYKNCITNSAVIRKEI